MSSIVPSSPRGILASTEARPVRRIREILRLQAECAADEVYEYFDTADALGLLVEVKEHY